MKGFKEQVWTLKGNRVFFFLFNLLYFLYLMNAKAMHKHIWKKETEIGA